jgi:2-polyprenyl-6-methoxyphenol hydroxylase-like FAD-dependent oxidoreductase
MNPQVLVIGAGPVGLTMAAELARYGVSVRIVDKAAQRTDKSKALVLWSRTLELLDRTGSSGAFVAVGHKVNAANIIAGRKVIGHLSISTVESPYPYALMLPQSETERLLEEYLNGQGVRVERQIELTTLGRHSYGNFAPRGWPGRDVGDGVANWMRWRT